MVTINKKTKTHVDYLLEHIPNLLSLSVMDMGSGRGGFLIDIARRGGQAIGLELNDAYIKETIEKARQETLKIEVIKGVAEQLPFADSSFDFINFALVVEHIENPELAVKEMSRVLKRGGLAYMGVPNRFGFWDPHFNLYLVNWLPRSWCNFFITIFGTHKDYSGPAGRQNLKDMHYFTFGGIKRLLNKYNLETKDIREEKIKKHCPSYLPHLFLLIPYRFVRFFFSDSFHLLLQKTR